MSLLTNLIPSLNRTPADCACATDEANTLGATVKPVYEVKETADAFGVTVYLPGVAKDGLELTADDGELRIVGRRAWQPPTGWTALHRETATAPFQLVLAHENAIATDKIVAELRDGVLQISLAKPEAAKPRKIAVN